jgi:hypothetical protein
LNYVRIVISYSPSLLDTVVIDIGHVFACVHVELYGALLDGERLCVHVDTLSHHATSIIGPTALSLSKIGHELIKIASFAVWFVGVIKGTAAEFCPNVVLALPIGPPAAPVPELPIVWVIETVDLIGIIKKDSL